MLKLKEQAVRLGALDRRASSPALHKRQSGPLWLAVNMEAAFVHVVLPSTLSSYPPIFRQHSQLGLYL